MTGTTEQIEAAAHRFNVAKCDLKYLTAHNSSPGILEMLNAGDDYEYFGSLAEHECHLARLAEVKDKDSLIDACINLRDCGYDDPSVVDKVKAAAKVVGDPYLMEGIASITDRAEIIETILHGYDCGNVGFITFLMDGSAIARFPLSRTTLPVDAENAA